MSPRTPAKRSSAMKAPRRAKKGISVEARAVHAEVQRCVKQLEKSTVEIQQDLRKAERKLEADARARIRELRKKARTHVRVLKAKQREAASILSRVSSAVGGAWDDVKRTADSVLVDAQATATAAVKRFRSAVGA